MARAFVVAVLLWTVNVVAVSAGPALTLEKRLNNGVGVTPAMGWNNYNSGLGSTAANALAAGSALVSLGLDKLGSIH
ncbi:MAG: hypothetical protein MMC23_008477 [Stictis urceolatum]|nr:hypothetical protein [Stictis urceolata]